MKRIMVIGCCGAGKSTLSRQIHEQLGLPLIHLDQHYWKPGWKETAPAEWEKIVRNLASGDQWIIDGNYNGTMDIRLEKADTVVLVKASTITCLFRVIKRIIQNYGKVRSDMPHGCPERFDLTFLAYVLHFNRFRLPGLLKKLDKVKENKQVFVLDSKSKINSFFNRIPSH